MSTTNNALIPNDENIFRVNKELEAMNNNLIRLQANTEILTTSFNTWSSSLTIMKDGFGAPETLTKKWGAWGEAAKLVMSGVEAMYDEVVEQQERLIRSTETVKDAYQMAAQNIAPYETKVHTLLDLAKDENAAYESRAVAVQQLNAQIPDLHASLSEEGILTIKNKNAVDEYCNSLLKLEKAKMLIQKQVALQSQINEINEGEYDKYAKVGWLAKGNAAIASIFSSDGNGIFERYYNSIEKWKETLAKEEKKRLEKDLAAVKKESGKSLADADVATAIFGSSPDSNRRTGSYINQQANTIRQGLQQLGKIQLDAQSRIDAIILAAKKEAAKSKKEQLQLEHEEELKALQKRYDEIDTLEKDLQQNRGLNEKSKAEILNSRNALDKESEMIKSRQANDLNTLAEDTRKAIDGIWNEVGERSKTERTKSKDAVIKYYDDIIKKAKDAGATEEEINAKKIEFAPRKEAEIRQVDYTFNMKDYGFAQEVETKLIELSNKSLYIETDKQIRLLEIQRKYNNLKIEELEKINPDKISDEEKNQLKLANIQKESINIEMQALQNKQEIEDRYYLFKSTKERALLELSRPEIALHKY